MTVLESCPAKVIVAGCAYGGLSFVQNLLLLKDGKPLSAPLMPGTSGTAPELSQVRTGIELILLDERDGYFNTIGSPLSHVARPYVKPFWRKFREIKALKRKDVTFVQASLQKVLLQEQKIVVRNVETGEEEVLSYDYLVMATGLRREFPIAPQGFFQEEYMKWANEHIDAIEGAPDKTAVVVGGGAVGIEFAGELKNHHPDHRVILVHSRAKLLSNEPLPEEVKDKAADVLRDEGVELMLGQRPAIHTDAAGKHTLKFKDGSEMTPGFIFNATSKWTAITDYLPTDLLDKDGYVLVEEDFTLPPSAPNAGNHYAIGDIIPTTGIKRSGGAMIHGRMTAYNVYCSLLREEDPTFAFKAAGFPRSGPARIALAVGKQAVLYSPQGGLKWGVPEMQDTFGDDLAWTYILRFLHMTEIEPEKASSWFSWQVAVAGILAVCFMVMNY